MSASTAANDIWKPTSNRLSGKTIRISVAARTTLRKASAGRSSSTARNMMAIMIVERTVAKARAGDQQIGERGEPSRATAAHFLIG